MFVAFNMLAGQVHGPVLRLAQMWQDFQQVRISVSRLGDILNTPTEPLHRADKATPPSLQGRISFDHVIFRYRPDAPEVISDLTLDIEAGQMIGIVGSSGSGKSTLTKLVQRLFVPERGRVLVDGTVQQLQVHTIGGVVERAEANQSAPRLTYLARIRLRDETIKVDGKNVPLSPDMIASVEIKTGVRKVIEFILSPILRISNEAGKER